MTLLLSEALRHAQDLLHQRELDDALRAFASAENRGADPDSCCAVRWMVHMLLGDFASAWAESDAIRARGTADPQRFWQGEDLRGKRVILRCLHGLGDAVQFLRYVPALRAIADSLIIEVPPRFVELARCFEGVESVITWGSGAPRNTPAWDVQIEINELPYVFRTTSDQLPLLTRYIHLPKASMDAAKPYATGSCSLRVGLVWASGPWNSSRTIPFNLLRPIFDCSGCEFWNLQGGPEREDWSKLPPGPHLRAAEACEHSILGLAATIAQLDLIITSDTLAAHLAGALGVPAWVMLERAADWRWQHDRNDSPWYPSLRLFRQHRDHDWSGVIGRIMRELHAASQCRMVA
jgi:hypothetical protein